MQIQPMLLPTDARNIQNPLLSQMRSIATVRGSHIPQIAKVIVFEGCALVTVTDEASVEILCELKHFKEELKESSG